MPVHHRYKGGQVLTLFALKTLESGILTCSAENAFGVVETSVAVIFKNRKYSHKDMHIDNTRKDEESLMDIQF